MRIILATPIFPPEIGGPATYTQELATRLSGAHEITIVAYADEPEHDRETRLVAVSKKVFLPLRLWMYFYILLREAKHADVIYVQNAVASGLPAVMAGKFSKKPVVLKFVGDEAWERATAAGLTRDTLDVFLSKPILHIKIKLLFEIQRFVLNRVSKVVPPSQFLGDIIARHYGVPRERIEVNYNATEVPPLPDVHRKPHQILTASRLVAWKGVSGIIGAINSATALMSRFPDLKLVIAGEGPEEENLKQLVRKIGSDWAAHFEFAGRLAKEDILKLQKESGVFILNSTYEGLPHGVLESFATRTPVIATNIGGTNEAVLNEQTGLLVEPGDTKQLVKAIERIFDEPELRETLVAGGEAILKEKFSWGAHIQKLLAVFSSLTDN